MVLLRHETGHAINYAYQLYTTPEWKEVFGGLARLTLITSGLSLTHTAVIM
jgi:hypothetical protein